MNRDWTESLLPASFAGVKFWVGKATVPVGRKGALHEYPQRDQAFFESLGRQAQVHDFEAFIVGPDCFAQRDRLLAALAKGAGELVHPWLGRMQVKVGECSLTQERKAGGVASFSLKFHPDTPLTYPSARANTRQQLERASQSLLDAALARYQATLAQVDQARINLQALRSRLSGAYNLINQQFKPWLATFDSLGALVDSLVNAPRAISALAGNYFSDIKGNLGRFSQPSSDAPGDSALALNQALGRGYRGVLANATQQAEAAAQLERLPPASGKDTGLAAQALIDLLQDAVLVQLALLLARMPVNARGSELAGVPTLAVQRLQPVARPQVPVADDVLALRDLLDEVIWQAALRADAQHYPALSELRQLLATHLEAVAASGVRLVAVTPEQPLPALVLAYRRFADATRAGEIVQRNRVRHPGFVPPVPLQMAGE
ncbi:DNA circularization N-terminal domain-containing protein [Pseudomonas entomophila]|uniref:DNA circularization protein n=1 Tax=Pseudomonas entomophila TaxID=312306 RepID=UPI0023D812B9|nr:DNA circularization N-terminal domain-containing protein [Pseudomonas entomophila]MDF0730566.1 DNA circularization N-terminal domain-containing protein [Pseudomonas entomophila]